MRKRTERHRIDPNGRFSGRFFSRLAAFGPGFDFSAGWDAEVFLIGNLDAGLCCVLGTRDGDGGEVVVIIFQKRPTETRGRRPGVLELFNFLKIFLLENLIGLRRKIRILIGQKFHPGVQNSVKMYPLGESKSVIRRVRRSG